MKCWPLILIVAALPATAAAGWLPQLPFGTSGGNATATPHPAVVRIVAPGRDSVSYGSGTLVAKNDKHGLVITNWHVVNELTGQLTVVFADGFQSSGTVLKTDRDWDLAAITIWRPTAEPMRLANVAPQQGEELTIAGYGPGKYRSASGKCTQYVAPGPKFPFEIVELAASARQGDSGGPILNSRGELAGVLFGEGHGRTAGSYCGRVQWFLGSVGEPADLPANREMLVQNGPPARVGAPGSVVPSLGTSLFQTAAAPLSSTGRVQAQTAALSSPPRLVPVTRPDQGLPANPGPIAFASVPFPSRGASVQPLPIGTSDAAAFGPGGSRDIATADRFAAGTQSHDRHVTSSVEPLPRRSQSLGWTDIAGETRSEQLKTIFAAVGAAAMMLHTLSWLGTEKRAPEAKPKSKKSDDDE